MRYLSVFQEDKEVLKAFDDIFLKNKWYELDCTYSKGVFYKGIKEPKIKSDIIPLFLDVLEEDSTKLSGFKNNSIESIVFDPPFLFRNRKSENKDLISARFSYFNSFESLLEMYEKSLTQFKRILKNNGYVFFKCQDMTDGKFYCTHKYIIDMAEKLGFVIKDIAIKASSRKVQKDAKQQNCVAKIHTYWLVFRIKK